MALCPAHPDSTASLSISLGRDGETVVLHCHAGCEVPDIVRCAGLEMTDLFPPQEPRAKANGLGRIVDTYGYTDEAGELLYEVCRFDPKTFRQRRPDGNGGWDWSLNGTRRTMYRLPEVIAAVADGRRVFVAEGEKDVDALFRAGEVATCNPGGAGKWKDVAALARTVLADAEIIVVADKDKAGRAHAADVVGHLTAVAASVVVVEAATGKDASEHLGAGRTIDELNVIDVDDARRSLPLPDADQGTTDPAAGSVVDQALVDAVVQHLGYDVDRATVAALELAQKIDRTGIDRLARRFVDERLAERDQRLDQVVAITADIFLDQEDDPVRPLFGTLASEGHNITLTAAYKVGKSTLLENMAYALVTGTPFLGRFIVPEPKRLVLLNHELTAADQRVRLNALGLDREARERLAVVNLRGKRLALNTPSGAARLVSILQDHGAHVVAIDPWGVSMAHARLAENENDDATTWTTALDEIKDRAGCASAIIPVHRGRAEQAQGEEHGRGATPIDDWPDVRIILTRTPDGGRFIYSQGRATDLTESRLGFDPSTRRLSLDLDDLGVGRRQADAVALVATVEAIVTSSPGCSVRAIEKTMSDDGVGKDQARAAVKLAVRRGVVHFHIGPRATHEHHLGESHHETEPCPEQSRRPACGTVR